MGFSDNAMALWNGDLALPGGQVLYDFEEDDFGIKPDFDKDLIVDKVIVVHGVSNSTFTSKDGASMMKPAKSMLWNWPDEFLGPDLHYGFMFSVDSPIIGQITEKQALGKVPFLARVRQIPSQVRGHQPYYKLERYVPQYDANGAWVNPNVPATPTPAKAK